MLDVIANGLVNLAFAISEVVRLIDNHEAIAGQLLQFSLGPTL